jgi:hypothetical protein
METTDQTATGHSGGGQPIKILPGYMVALSTRVKGGIAYERIETDHQVEGKEDVTTWTTIRRIIDVDEYQRAQQVRTDARKLVAAQCRWTVFGQICPPDNIDNLNAAIGEARDLIEAFNETAEHSTIRLFTLKGEIANDDVEAIESISGSIRDLLGDLNDAVQGGDVKIIRSVAAQAKTMASLLDQQQHAQGALGRAIKAARRVASAIALKVEKEGVELADVLAAANTSAISWARFAFGDPDVQLPDGEEPPEDLPSAALARFAQLDLGPDPDLDDEEDDPDDDDLAAAGMVPHRFSAIEDNDQEGEEQ